ncbi:MAG: hypothetical protein Q4D02_03630 [Clostridia bacterium]|nr:hypothetical protein [Clostridia bacterium]
MNYSDFFEYEETVDRSLKSDKLLEYIKKYNIPNNDVIMYLAFSSCIAAAATRNNTRKMIHGKAPVNATCNQISSILSEYIFDKVDYFPSALDDYNAQFHGFDRLAGDHTNPYMISQQQFQDYLNGANTGEPQENIEEYLKVMALSNKASKILTVFRDYNTNQSLDIAHSINKKNYRSGNSRRFSTQKRDYIETYDMISALSNKPQENGVPLKVNFLNTYLKYIRKELTEEELKDSTEYKDMMTLFSKNNPNNCYINPASLYKNLSFNFSIDSLYLTKNLYFKKAVKEYSELSKTKKAYRYRITKSHDENIGETIGGNCYSSNIHFMIQGYNAPFSIHQDPNVIADLEKKYGISIEEGRILPPFTAVVPYKHTRGQRNGIGFIHMNRIKRLHPNSKEAKISEFSNNMQFYVKGITPISNEDLELENFEKNNLEIPDEELPTPNVDDDADAPSI